MKTLGKMLIFAVIAIISGIIMAPLDDFCGVKSSILYKLAYLICGGCLRGIYLAIFPFPWPIKRK